MITSLHLLFIKKGLIKIMNEIEKIIKDVKFTVDAYTHNGHPLCAKDFSKGEVCRFYINQRMGMNETCLFADKSGKYWQELNRRDNGEGTLIPMDNCPVWSDSDK